MCIFSGENPITAIGYKEDTFYWTDNSTLYKMNEIATICDQNTVNGEKIKVFSTQDGQIHGMALNQS